MPFRALMTILCRPKKCARQNSVYLRGTPALLHQSHPLSKEFGSRPQIQPIVAEDPRVPAVFERTALPGPAKVTMLSMRNSWTAKHIRSLASFSRASKNTSFVAVFKGLRVATGIVPIKTVGITGQEEVVKLVE